jgi:cell filamentation protein
MEACMNRYRIVGSEAECEPGSKGLVLRNLLSITDPEEMANVEQGLLRQLYEAVLTDSASEGRLTTRMLMAWHGRWLGNVYAWAGAERAVNVSKDGFAFATAAFISDLLREFQKQQLDVLTPCQPTSIDELLNALSSVHEELILIHPFREGNGRIARLLCDVMAVQAEVGPLDYKEWDHRPGDYFAAIRAGVGRDLKPMKQLFKRALPSVD